MQAAFGARSHCWKHPDLPVALAAAPDPWAPPSPPPALLFCGCRPDNAKTLGGAWRQLSGASMALLSSAAAPPDSESAAGRLRGVRIQGPGCCLASPYPQVTPVVTATGECSLHLLPVLLKFISRGAPPPSALECQPGQLPLDAHSRELRAKAFIIGEGPEPQKGEGLAQGQRPEPGPEAGHHSPPRRAGAGPGELPPLSWP